MISFKQYLVLLESEDDGKLKHIEHLDDMHIHSGPSGIDRAITTLHAAKAHSEGSKSGHQLSTKFDGSPSIVFGKHPETGKFFVASKSAFNKNPKINYTPEDIEKNHGHAPGLVEKLKHALKHLPKISPKTGVFQGDVMHSGAADITKHPDGSVSFKPNTLTYKAKGEDAEKAKRAKFGLAPHTQYKGSTLEDMKAEPINDHSIFKHSPDVHNISPEFKTDGKAWSKEHTDEFNRHIDVAKSAAKQINHENLDKHREHLKTYINHTVRTNTKPTLSSYVDHITSKRDKAIDSVKTEKSKESKAKHFNDIISSAVITHKEDVSNALVAQQHLEKAKEIAIHHLEKSNSGLSASVGDKEGHEGYVSTHTGGPIKLVDRKNFSAANFARNG